MLGRYQRGSRILRACDEGASWSWGRLEVGKCRPDGSADRGRLAVVVLHGLGGGQVEVHRRRRRRSAPWPLAHKLGVRGGTAGQLFDEIARRGPARN